MGDRPFFYKSCLQQKDIKIFGKILKMCHNISDWKKVWQILNQKKANLILIL